jgi:hypothetical protein
MGNAATKEPQQLPTIVTTEKVYLTVNDVHQDEEFTVQTEGSGSIFNESSECTVSPTSGMTMDAVETEQVYEDFDSVVSAITLYDSVASADVIRWWDGTKFFSDYVQDGLKALGASESNICMVFENPSTSPQEPTFFNGNTFKFHEYPPSPPLYKAVLTPCRYSMMNGNVYPSYLQGGVAPSGLVDHWMQTIPGFIAPLFVPEIPSEGKVYAYLPMESISNYVNDPHVHYHLAGKDALHLSTL